MYVYLDIELKLFIINSCICVYVCIKCSKIHTRNIFDRKHRFIIKNFLLINKVYNIKLCMEAYRVYGLHEAFCWHIHTFLLK